MDVRFVMDCLKKAGDLGEDNIGDLLEGDIIGGNYLVLSFWMSHLLVLLLKVSKERVPNNPPRAHLSLAAKKDHSRARGKSFGSCPYLELKSSTNLELSPSLIYRGEGGWDS